MKNRPTSSARQGAAVPEPSAFEAPAVLRQPVSAVGSAAPTPKAAPRAGARHPSRINGKKASSTASGAAPKAAPKATPKAAPQPAPEPVPATSVAAPKAANGRVRKRLSRAERAVEARQTIFEAAAQVVGQHGYADASITRITEAAGIAQGTFYLYFRSRQELFDELLPHMGHNMLHFIGDRIRGSKDLYEMEERGFRGFFDYLKANPGFFRILNEAEVASPIAHRTHFKLLSERYVEALERGVRDGTIRHFALDELETLAYMFMAARSYLYLRYVKGEKGARKLPDKVVRTYMKLVREGLR